MTNSDLTLLVTMSVFGLAYIILTGVNAGVFIVHRNTQKTAGPSSSFGKWAWGLSVVSLPLVLLAPVALIMAIVDLRKGRAETSKHYRLPAKMALVNSGFSSMYFIVLIWGIFVLEWL